MSYSYSLVAASCPAPIAPTPSALALGYGTYGHFVTGMTAGTTEYINQLQKGIELMSQAPAGGYGTIYGLDLTCPSGLQIALGNGLAWVGMPLEIVSSGTPIGWQITQPSVLTLPASAQSWVWLTVTYGSSGTPTVGLTYTTTVAPPSNAVLFLGLVTMGATTISGNIDYSGRVYCSGNQLQRTTADVTVPTDTPPANLTIQTKTVAGPQYFWDGVSHKQLLDPAKQIIYPVAKRTIAANLSLAITDANIQQISSSGTSYTITLPPVANLTPGNWWNIQNIDSTATYTIKTPGGTTICTLTAGHSTGVIQAIGTAGGTIGYPSTIVGVSTGTPTT